MSVRIRISVRENPKRCEPNAEMRFLMASAVLGLLDMIEPLKACSPQRQFLPPDERQLTIWKLATWSYACGTVTLLFDLRDSAFMIPATPRACQGLQVTLTIRKRAINCFDWFVHRRAMTPHLCIILWILCINIFTRATCCAQCACAHWRFARPKFSSQMFSDTDESQVSSQLPSPRQIPSPQHGPRAGFGLGM